MQNYGFSYIRPDAVPVTPEKYLELRQLYPGLRVLRIVPPSPEGDDYGRILILASSMKRELAENAGQPG